MTVPSTTSKSGPFLGDGAATSFVFDFKVFTKADIEVVLTDTSGVDTTLVLDSDYSVVLNTDQNTSPGGTVTYPITGSPLPTGASLVIARDVAYTQETDITNAGGFYPQVIEDALDKSTMLIQQLLEQVGRQVAIPLSEDGGNFGLQLPAASKRASQFLAFDANGNVVVSDGPGADGGLRGDLASTDPSKGAALVGLPHGTVADAISYVTPQMFGAKADGVTDDTTAVNAAIAVAGKVKLFGDCLVSAKNLVFPDGKILDLSIGALKTNFSSVTGSKIRFGGVFTAIPTLTISGDGSGAAADAIMGAYRPTISAAGSGYSYRDEVTVTGGTNTIPVKIRITGVDGTGAVTNAFISDPGSYTTLPSGPVSVTGGTGTGATFTLQWQIVDLSITNAGAGYVGTPTVSASSPIDAPVIDLVGELLDLKGIVFAPAAHVFKGYGAITNNLVNATLLPEWWGAGDGVDSQAAIQKALDAASGKTVLLADAAYVIKSPVTPPATCTIQGINRNASVLQVGAACHAIRLREGFDCYIRDIGIKDPNNLMSLVDSGIYFDPTRYSIQRTYFENILIDIAGRGIGSPNFERNEIFGCEFRNVSIYSTGASAELFYTTGLKFEHVLGEHIGRPQDSSVLRDFWFYASTAMLGGGLVLIDVISRAPANSGIVPQGPGGTYAYPKYLQAWFYNCSTDNCPSFGVDIVNGEQITIQGGYFALSGSSGSGTDIRALGDDIIIQDTQNYDGKSANIVVIGPSNRVMLSGNKGRQNGTFAASPIIQVDNSFGQINEVQLVNNTCRDGSKGIQVVGAVNFVQVVGNALWYNGAGPADGLDISTNATNVTNVGNAT